MLTPAQLATIKAHITASNDMNTQPADEPGAQVIAELFNAPASPPFWVFKSKITEEEITGAPSADATAFSWTAFIQRSQGERDGWMRLFRSGQVNPSLLNVRAAMNDIFSGAGQGATQRIHIDASIRRAATRLEKLLATGTGSTAAPGTMGREGVINITEVQEARA